MQQENFSYRNQLIAIFHSLQETANGIYGHAFQLALDGELMVMNKVLKDGDKLPIDPNYLKALKCPVIRGLVELIDDVLKLQESLFNVNALTEEELRLPEDESEENIEVRDPNTLSEPACLEALIYTFESFMDLYISVWQLANSSLDEPDEVIDQFEKSFCGNDLCLPSQDANVQMMLNALNAMLAKNRLIDYWEAEGQRKK